MGIGTDLAQQAELIYITSPVPCSNSSQ